MNHHQARIYALALSPLTRLTELYLGLCSHVVHGLSKEAARTLPSIEFLGVQHLGSIDAEGIVDIVWSVIHINRSPASASPKFYPAYNIITTQGLEDMWRGEKVATDYLLEEFGKQMSCRHSPHTLLTAGLPLTSKITKRHLCK